MHARAENGQHHQDGAISLQGSSVLVYLQLLGIHATSRAASALQDDHLEAKAAQLPGSCKTCSQGLHLHCAAGQALQETPLNDTQRLVLAPCFACDLPLLQTLHREAAAALKVCLERLEDHMTCVELV